MDRNHVVGGDGRADGGAVGFPWPAPPRPCGGWTSRRGPTGRTFTPGSAWSCPISTASSRRGRASPTRKKSRKCPPSSCRTSASPSRWASSRTRWWTARDAAPRRGLPGGAGHLRPEVSHSGVPAQAPTEPRAAPSTTTRGPGRWACTRGFSGSSARTSSRWQSAAEFAALFHQGVQGRTGHHELVLKANDLGPPVRKVPNLVEFNRLKDLQDLWLAPAGAAPAKPREDR